MQKPNKQDLFIWFLELKPHEHYKQTYYLWEHIIPYAGFGSYEDSDTPELKFSNECHITEFKFETDWNWLMHLVKQIRSRIIIPMDCDLNNWQNDQYQNLRGYFLRQLEDINKEKLYIACVEMLEWWNMIIKWKERQKEKTNTHA